MCLCAFVPLCLSVQAAWGGVEGAEDGLGYLEVYPGLEATLFASEPMMASPTNIDVDERGRVWVCEVMNYRGHALEEAREEGDRILILEDTDGDGKADKSTVFYQGRDIDAALGICVLANERGEREVIVSAAPNIWRFVDVDGDDKPDRKEQILTGTGKPQSDHSTHSVVFGPDGRYYWNFGNSGYAAHDSEGRLIYDQRGFPVADNLVARLAEQWDPLRLPYSGGMAFRMDGNGRRLDVLGHNFRNNYELAVDSFGNVWQTDNDDDGFDGCRINYIIEGGNYGYRDEVTGASWRTERPGQHAEIPSRHWHQNDPGVVPNFLQTGAGSPTGITVYEGRLLPQVFWDQVISCDAGPGVVWAARATKEGAGFRGELTPILKTRDDRWFRPVDVATAPDGSLFVSDWYDPYVGWNRQGDRARGRIYRIAPRGHRYRPIPPQDLDSPENAVFHLRSPNAATRSWGWFNATDEDLADMFDNDPNLRFRARAFWRMAAKAEEDPNGQGAAGDADRLGSGPPRGGHSHRRSPGGAIDRGHFVGSDGSAGARSLRTSAASMRPGVAGSILAAGGPAVGRTGSPARRGGPLVSGSAGDRGGGQLGRLFGSVAGEDPPRDGNLHQGPAGYHLAVPGAQDGTLPLYYT